MKTLFTIITAVLLLTSCVKKETPVTNQEKIREYGVSYLFEFDGVKVYKFRDGDTTVYFTNRVGEVKAESESTRMIGRVHHTETKTTCTNCK